MSSPEISILIADDYPIFRDGLAQLLRAEPGFRVTGTATDRSTTISLVRNLAPDVLLFDPAMPPGLELLRELVGLRDGLRTVILTAEIKPEKAVEALEQGARGIVLKDTPTSLLFKCIRVVMAGEYWVGRGDVSTLVEALRRAEHGHNGDTLSFGLTPREREVLKAVLSGATNNEIAVQLRIREDTVKHHITSMFDKCGVSNRVELAMLAVHHQLVA